MSAIATTSAVLSRPVSLRQDWCAQASHASDRLLGSKERRHTHVAALARRTPCGTLFIRICKQGACRRHRSTPQQGIDLKPAPGATTPIFDLNIFANSFWPSKPSGQSSITTPRYIVAFRPPRAAEIVGRRGTIGGSYFLSRHVLECHPSCGSRQSRCPSKYPKPWFCTREHSLPDNHVTGNGSFAKGGPAQYSACLPRQTEQSGPARLSRRAGA